MRRYYNVYNEASIESSRGANYNPEVFLDNFSRDSQFWRHVKTVKWEY